MIVHVMCQGAVEAKGVEHVAVAGDISAIVLERWEVAVLHPCPILRVLRARVEGPSCKVVVGVEVQRRNVTRVAGTQVAVIGG